MKAIRTVARIDASVVCVFRFPEKLVPQDMR
jgi:hypothetical protein